MSRRAILLAAVAAVAAAAGARAVPPPASDFHDERTVVDGADTAGPLDIVSLAVAQDGDMLVLALRTRGRWTPAALAAPPGRSVCFVLGATTPLCLTADGRLSAGGAPVTAEVARTSRREVRVRLAPTNLGLAPGAEVSVGARTTWVGGRRCRPTAARPQPCVDVAPDAGTLSLRLVGVRPVGCGPVTPGLVLDAPAAGRTVALTFDDGPGESTPEVLRVLEAERVPATFFLIGREVAGREALVRRMLADGNALGDHSWDHADLADAGPHGERELTETNAAIVRASGYQPCLFRAPFGATSPALIAEAGALGMLTVGWDVDPRDWARPGADAIFKRIVSAVHPGAIVLMHDGGGPREETAAALPRVIARLRAERYDFATVPQLLGLPVISTPAAHTRRRPPPAARRV